MAYTSFETSTQKTLKILSFKFKIYIQIETNLNFIDIYKCLTQIQN